MRWSHGGHLDAELGAMRVGHVSNAPTTSRTGVSGTSRTAVPSIVASGRRPLPLSAILDSRWPVVELGARREDGGRLRGDHV